MVQHTRLLHGDGDQQLRLGRQLIGRRFHVPIHCNPFTGEVTSWGQNATLSVDAWGSSLNYHWYYNGVALTNDTSATLTLSSIQFTNVGQYSVVVSSIFGSVSNAAAAVVVNPAGVMLELCPNVVIQGTVGYNYTIQSSTNLANPNAWTTLTNLTLTQPVQFWDDTSIDTSQLGNSHNFYRVLPGQ